MKGIEIFNHNSNAHTIDNLFETTSPAVEISSLVLNQASEAVQLEKQTIMHCRLFTRKPTLLRIHPGTFLIETDGIKRKLITAHHISIAPKWNFGKFKNGFHYFTLVFEGLSENCSGFHLKETAAPGETNLFYTNPIERNKTDVYETEVWSD